MAAQCNHWLQKGLMSKDCPNIIDSNNGRLKSEYLKFTSITYKKVPFALLSFTDSVVVTHGNLDAINEKN